MRDGTFLANDPGVEPGSGTARGGGLIVAIILIGPSCMGSVTGGGDGPSGTAADPDDPFAPAGVQAPVVGREFDCTDPSRQDPGPGLVRRHTVGEYVATLRAALDVDVSDLASTLPIDIRGAGYDNAAITQAVSFEHVSAFANVAQQAVARIDDLPAFVGSHAPCTDYEASCIEGFLESVAVPIYRRPLEEADRSPLLPIFDQAEALDLPFVEAAKYAIEAMLQSVRFLYRVETERGSGGVRPLDSYEVASRLSYLVWGSAPDDELYRAAAAGELNDAPSVAAQMERMLAEPRAEQTSLGYLQNWLQLYRLDAHEMGSDMREETNALFLDTLWGDTPSLSRLFNAQHSFLTPELAEHYGLTPQGAGMNRYDLSDQQTRQGLLTHASVLTSGGPSASYVQRGLFVLENILCGKIEPPPIGVNDTPPEIEPGRPQRFYSEQRVENAGCGGCHSQFEPGVYALGVFDADGAPLTEDSAGNPVQSDGILRTPYDPEGIPYDDVAQYVEVVSSNERVRDCLLLKVSQHALGRNIDVADACTLDSLRSAVEKGDVGFADVLRNLAGQEGFRTIRVEP